LVYEIVIIVDIVLYNALGQVFHPDDIVLEGGISETAFKEFAALEGCTALKFTHIAVDVDIE
jgi:hypothetical protein